MRPLDFSRDIAARWEMQTHAGAELLSQAGITAILLDHPKPEFAEACRRREIAIHPRAALPCHSLLQLPASGICALDDGIWPGISQPGKAEDPNAVASASNQPWLDANGFRVQHLRALFPNRPAVLAYQPNEKAGVKAERLLPYSSLELALVEAWAWGGNFLLTLDGDLTKALEQNDPKAMSAWGELGRTTRWLREQRAMFGFPAVPVLTTLVEDSEETAEITNLQVRNNASPALAPLVAPPRPDPQTVRVLVAVNLAEKSRPAAAAAIIDHARRGATVIVDEPGADAWWRGPGLQRIKEESDRITYRLGAGAVVGYKERISDPSEFALDAIDFVGQPNRAVRLWAAPTVLARAVGTPHGAALIAVNYGQPIDVAVQSRIRGHYRRATMIRPDGAPTALQAVRRGETTEVQVPQIRKVAIIVFE
ncbi:MAG: hypothetical protein IT160_01865 [Bryobacterales bacterium]|nr:hypothetical protein [Bryobacterales bacterium]